MTLSKTVFVVPILLNSLMLIFLMALSWTHRKKRLAQSFLAVLGCLLVWSLAHLLEVFSNTLSNTIFWENVRITGSFSLSLFWLVFVGVYTGHDALVKKYSKYLILYPVILIALMWSDSTHHLFRHLPGIVRPVYGFPVLNNSYTSFFYLAFSPYTAVVYLASLGLLAESFRKSRGKVRSQLVLLTAAMIIPLLAELMFLLGTTPVPQISFTSQALLLGSILLGRAVFQFDLFQSVLLARDVVLETLQDGVIVIDRYNQLLDINPAAMMMLGLTASKASGILAGEALKAIPNHAELLAEQEICCCETHIGQLFLEVNVMPVRDSSQAITARIFTLHDVTERVLLFEQIKQLASYDALTGVLNRSVLFEKADDIVSAARGGGAAFSLIMLDIDQFKRINDLFGHQTGDRALKAVVDLCAAQLRAGDLVGRYGGEEFVVVLPDTNLKEAQQISERLRQTIEQSPLDTHKGYYQITSSFGVACSDLFGEEASLEKMICAADQALYEAKGKGANQVVVVDQPRITFEGLYERVAA
ncbi:MAG: diguanylate cyclase [Chloroflexi bacterium]|nr:diguanylate cyclase [Chloroflexota bacterium]